jgi:tetratricopeptide (TPR) repeat protein
MQRYLYITLLYVVLATPAVSQWIADSAFIGETRAGINAVYNLSFDSARSYFQRITERHPGHPSGHFLLAMVEWWKILINIDNESNDDHFVSMLEDVISICDTRLEKDENDLAALFFKGGALGFRGRLYAHREDWVLAANDGRRALPIVEKCFALAPQNDDVLLGKGIYNYYASVIPERYPVVRPLMIFFPDGERELGISQLRKASKHALYADIEASYFLLQLQYSFEKNYAEATQIATDLHRRFPENVIFHRYLGRCLAALNQWDDAARVFGDINDRVKSRATGYSISAAREASYYIGSAHMASGRYREALQEYYRCDEVSREVDKSGPSGFMVMTNLRIGMIYDLESRRDDAIGQYRKVLDMSDYQQAHSMAERYIREPYGKH